MAKSNKNKDEEKQIFETILSESGLKVVCDKSKCDGHALMKARTAGKGDDTKVTFFLIAECCTFNDEKMRGDEILNLSAFDLLDLETFWFTTAKKYQVLAVSSFSQTKQDGEEKKS